MSPACPECGYDLTGLGGDAVAARCPECGALFRPDRPDELRPPWPSPLRVAARLCLPGWGVMAAGPVVMAVLYAVLAPFSVMLAGFVAMGVLIGATVAGLVIAPWQAAQQLARRHASYGRAGINSVVIGAAFVANLVVWLAMIGIASAFFR